MSGMALFLRGLDRVADVDDLRVRHEIQDDTFHRPYEVIVRSEIGSERDDSRQVCSLADVLVGRKYRTSDLERQESQGGRRPETRS